MKERVAFWGHKVSKLYVRAFVQIFTRGANSLRRCCTNNTFTTKQCWTLGIKKGKLVMWKILYNVFWGRFFFTFHSNLYKYLIKSSFSKPNIFSLNISFRLYLSLYSRTKYSKKSWNYKTYISHYWPFHSLLKKRYNTDSTTLLFWNKNSLLFCWHYMQTDWMVWQMVSSPATFPFFSHKSNSEWLCRETVRLAQLWNVNVKYSGDSATKRNESTDTCGHQQCRSELEQKIKCLTLCCQNFCFSNYSLSSPCGELTWFHHKVLLKSSLWCQFALRQHFSILPSPHWINLS